MLYRVQLGRIWREEYHTMSEVRRYTFQHGLPVERGVVHYKNLAAL